MSTAATRPAERIAIIGAGLMGHGLAQVFAVAGHPVRIHDARQAALDSVCARVRTNLAALGQDPGAVALIEPVADLADCVVGAELVIEAVSEDLPLKRSVFTSLERAAPERAILATNTSVIPVGAIFDGLDSAGRMVGTHFWNPPALIPLVEVVQGPHTSASTIAATMELLRSAGKCPVHVHRDVPGFVGNRLQHALWREAISLVADGICDAETIDLVVTQGFGPRLGAMGPLENADLVGLDLTLAIHEHVLPDLDRTPGPSPLLRELVDAGRLGMKTGSGLREWPPGSADRSMARLMAHLSDRVGSHGCAITDQEGDR